MRLGAKRWLVLPVAAVVAMVSFSALPSAHGAVANAVAPRSASVTAVTAATAACKDVLFVGARGSGETGPGDIGWKATRSDPYGLGGPVENVRERVTADLGSHRSIQVLSVSYEANGVQTLLHAPNQYFAGIATGVTWTLGVLGGQARKCPAQQIVLSGYSQGAMIMHRVIQDLGNSFSGKAILAFSGKAILARVAAAVVAGDGDELPHDNQTRFGTASTDARGIGQSLRTVSHASAKPFSAALTARVLSVCNNHDIVCGWTNFNLACLTRPRSCVVPIATQVKIHLSYPHSKPLLAAADRAAALVRELPAPRPAALSTTAGTSLKYQLKADVAAGWTLQWRVAPGKTVPSWLSLKGTGLITGKPAAAGKVSTTIQVRAVRAKAASPWLPAALSITVAPVTGVRNWTSAELSLSLDGNIFTPNAMSCPTVSFCVAVGEIYAGNQATGVLATWSGGAWSVSLAPLPANTLDPAAPYSWLQSVSCPSASYCVAVGTYYEPGQAADKSYSETGMVLVYSRGSWTATTAPVDPSANSASTGWVVTINNVSCPATTSFCMAVGLQSDGDGIHSYSWALTISAGTWHTTAGIVAAGDLYDVSCPSASYCLAGDSIGVAAWSSTGWKKLLIPLPSTAVMDGGTGTPAGTVLACTPAGDCLVSGEYEDIYGHHWPLYKLSGTTWTILLNDNTSDLMRGAACPSARLCVFSLAETISGSVLNNDGRMLEYANGAWSQAANVLPANAAAGDSGTVSNISCPSTTECLALGNYTTDPSHTRKALMFVTFTP
jgi:hypothetical protein